MAWHPRLVVRFGRGKAITSPTSHVGYVFLACWSVGFISIVSWIALKTPMLWVAVGVPGAVLRDVWAWFASSEEEKGAFREEIARLVALGNGRPPDQVRMGTGWGPGVLVLLLAVMGGTALLTLHVSEFFWLPGFMATALFVVSLVDQARALLRKG